MEKQPSSRTCFLCGRENDRGLKMTWYSDREKGQVWSKVTIPSYFNGYPGFVHGGIIAALLDETSGRAILLEGEDNLFVTAKLEVTYRKPTPTDQPLTVVGWIVKGNSTRAQVEGEIRLEDGTVTAQARAIVLRPPKSFFETCNWEGEKEYWKVFED
ncbi:MAG: PaaI family thioesterase [Chitinophagales bacterium]